MEEALRQDKPDALDKYRSEKIVLFLVGLSLNVSMPTYLSYVNVYGAEFHHKSVLGWMSVCIFASSVVIVLLQERFDAHFDAQSAVQAYTFRIVLGLFIAVLVLLAIPFAKQVWHVYLLGIICGIFEGASISSINQLASTIHPEMTKYANTGLTFGPGVPAILSAALGFHHTDAPFQTKLLYAWLPTIFPLVAAVTLLLTVCFCQLEGFNQAFTKIQRRASRRGLQPKQQLDPNAFKSETDPFIQEDPSSSSSSRSTSWSWLQVDFLICGLIQFSAHGLARGMVPFLAYLGDLTLAHLLVLNSFMSELAGRVAAHVVSLKTLGCQRGIGLLLTLSMIRVSLGVLVLLQAVKQFDLGVAYIQLIVGAFFFLYGWVANEVQVVVVEMGPKNQSADITRGMMLFNYGGQVVGLCVTMPLVALAFV